MKRLFIYVLAIFLFSACGNKLNKGFRMVNVDQGFSLELPGRLEPMSDLHDFAALQYGNDQDGFYLVGIREPKAELHDINLYMNLEDYAHFVTKTLKSKVDTVLFEHQTAYSHKGMKGMLTEFTGAILGGAEPLKIGYRVAAYESDSHFYQMTIWSDDHQIKENQEAIHKIICSFQETPSQTTASTQRTTAGEGSR